MPKSIRFLKGQITKAEKRASTMEDYNVYSLRHFLEELENDFAEFKEYFSGDDTGDANAKDFEEYERKYERSVGLLQEEIDKRLGRTLNDTLAASPGSERFMISLMERQKELNETIGRVMVGMPKNNENRLPTLKIPIFSGVLKEWVRFKNLFLNRIDQNNSLNNVEKFGHLLTLVSGEPASLIKHIPLTEHNYTIAWDLLMSKYEKPYKIANYLISEVTRAPHITSKSKLRHVFQLLAETVSALDSMSPYAKTRDPWVIHIVVDKFDKDLKERWAREIANEDAPSLERLIEFLSKEDDALDNTGAFESEEKTRSIREQRGFKVNSTVSANCFVCSGNHTIYDCVKFRGMAVKLRTDLVRSKNRCLNCLTLGHYVGKCKSKGKCSKCGRRHHTLLHYDSAVPLEPLQKTDQKDGGSSDPLVKVNLNLNNGSGVDILPTAMIEVLGDDNSLVKCRALLDTGAQASFITERCLKRLKLKRSSIGILYEPMSSQLPKKSRGSVDTIFHSVHNKDIVFSSTFIVVSHITGLLPANNYHYESKKILNERFTLADPQFDEPAEIDVLLSADILFACMKSEKYFHKVDNLWIVESSLGWLVSGGRSCAMPCVKVNSNFVSQDANHLDELVGRFWELEEVKAEIEPSEEDLYCEKLFTSTTRRLDNGRYSVSLPYKPEHGNLGKSYSLARNRFIALEKKFKYNANLRIEYQNIMDNFKSRGFIEKVIDSISNDSKRIFYLPHHRVGLNKQKLRIVFDASMKTDNGTSLNDVLLSGPNLQVDIRTLLLEFRFYKYVFVADIVKMYRQIFINEDSKDSQRFLWRETPESEIEEYRIVTVTDGLSCSPYLALRTMLQLAKDEGTNFPKGASYLSKRYMDDFFVGNNSKEELKDIQSQLISILDTACMTLGKWCANDETILSNIALEERLPDHSREIRFSATIRTLGIDWDYRLDHFSYLLEFQIPLKKTKRSLLSDSARFYDPLGWITPVTVTFKIIFQEVCIRKLEWDEDLPDDIVKKWLCIRENVKGLSEVRIPRWLKCSSGIQLHGFCDASLKAYACVIYSQCCDSSGGVTIRLVMAKSRVAPVKPISIARLELCAANLLAETMNYLKNIFECWEPSLHCWTDSMTVISWLAASPSRWNNFVANRCGNVHRLIPNVRWRYIKSSENPADVASRGIDSEALLNHKLWWSGPSVMLSSHERDEIVPVDGIDIELRKTNTIRSLMVQREEFWSDFLKKYSSFNRTIHVLAYVIRVINYKRVENRGIHLSCHEIQNSFDIAVKKLQILFYGQEINDLKRLGHVKKNSTLRSVDPLLDEVGLLRAGGRINNAPMSYDAKFPVIMPRSPFLEQLIRYYHEKYYHADRKLLITLLKQKFWVPGILRIVKKVLGMCKKCRTLKAVTYSPKMGLMPEFRLRPQKPFLVSGIDFAGPIVVRPFRCRGRASVKSYIAIFVCMVTRALHLELVFGLDVGSLVNALRRFVSRRGRCQQLLSDHGTNFVACKNMFSSVTEHIKKNVEDPMFKEFLLNEVIEWKMIPPGTPHMGGLWESGVRSVKSLIARKFISITPTIEEFSTALAEVESLLNSRPLFAINNDSNEPEILTPSHLINGFATSTIPFEDNRDSYSKITASKRYNYLSNIVRGFWREWSNNYYNEMRKIFKWQRDGKGPQLNDLVLVRRSNTPPSLWPMGRVDRIFPGPDGVVRVVDVRTKNGTKREAIRNLVPLTVEV